MRGWAVFGFIIALALIGFGIFYPVPEKYVNVSDSRYAYEDSWIKDRGAKYLGGDAYNYQVEATLKAGYMAGVLAMKSITFVGGILLFFISIFAYYKSLLLERSNELSFGTKSHVEEIKKICQNP